jgi:hypothetical protein
MRVVSRLRARWYLVLIAAILGILVSGLMLLKLGKDGLHEKHQKYYVGTAQLLVDTNPSTLTNVLAAGNSLGGRAALIAQYSTGANVVDRIAKLAGLPVSQLSVQSATTSVSSSGAAKSKTTLAPGGPNSVVLRTTHASQTIDITTQSSSKAAARNLASATVSAMKSSLRQLQNSQSYNHTQTSSPTTSTATSTTSTTGKASGKTKSGGSQASARRLAAARSAAQQAHARSVSLSKIVLRTLGPISAQKVLVTPKKSKVIGYGLGVFVILVLIILLLDNILVGRHQAKVAEPASVPFSAATAGPSSESTPE